MKATRKQALMLDALIEHGHNKLIGRALNIEERSVSMALLRLKQIHNANSNVTLAIMWERFKREQQTHQ